MSTHNKTSFFNRAWKILALAGFILCFSATAYAQNAKGDRPVNNKKKLREVRFKSRHKQGDRARTRDVAGRRVRTKNKSSANRAVITYKEPKAAKIRQRGRDTDRAGKPLSPVYGSGPRDTQRAWKGRRANVRSATGRSRNVFPQFGRYNRNPAQRPHSTQHPVSNRSQLARLKKMQSDPGGGDRKRKVTPRSASRSYIARKSINPIARFKRPAKKGERATTKDLAGRKLRGRNFETKRPPIQSAGNPYYGRKRIGDRPYSGPAGGGHISATKQRERAWRGDVAGRKIRGRNYSSKAKTSGSVTPFRARAPKPKYGDHVSHGKKRGVGFKTASRPPEKRTGKMPLPVRPPGMGADGMRKYSGNLKGKRPLKGGGSVSGKLWNNRGTPLEGRPPSAGTQRAGRFQGNIKSRRPDKGGGSVSGKLWNNNQTPLAGRPPSGAQQRAGRFQGNIKSRRPDKGGGSVSGKLWNNNQTPITGRPPSNAQQRAGRFQGNIKARRPDKGGGSVSGKLWNNNETPLEGRPPSNAQQRAGRFQGNIKARRPDKGGGSVSGTLWNNKEKPIQVKPPSEASLKSYRHRGDHYMFELKPDMRNQGEEFTGYIKLKPFRKNYLKNPNAADDALKKARPDKSTYKVDDLHVKVKQYRYVRNPSSADGALKVREPGEAFGKATDYQGNIKMKKFDLFERKKYKLHPDAQFVKINKNNVPEERDALTNLKLWWARLFKKNDTQPEHLKDKDKDHKPRYDKGEKGLWYE